MVKKKKTAALLGGIVANLEEVKTKELEIEVVNYKSKFDFEEHKVSDIKETLIKYEESVVFNNAKSIDHRFNVAEALFLANKELSNRGSGTYTAWCENLGITREKSSVYIKRYNLFIEINDERVKSLPDMIIKKLSNNSVSIEDKFRVIESDNPKEVLEQLNSLSVELTSYYKPRTPFYKPILAYGKKVEKIEPTEAYEELKELEEAERTLKKYKKLLKEKINIAELENSIKIEGN